MSRVLLIRSSLRLGGVERQSLDHCLRLQRLGWQPCLACLFRGEGLHPLVEAAERVGIAASTIRDASPLAYSTWRQLRKLLADFDPAVIHSCDYRSDVLVALSAHSRPWLAESHGHTAETNRMAMWNRIDRQALRRANAVVAVSAAWETQLAASGVSPSRLITAENSRAILADSPIPQPAPMPGLGPHLVFAGRLSPEKGLDSLLSAWQEIRRAYPDAHLWILGAPAASKSYARRLAGWFDQPGVSVQGHVADVRSWLLAADVVIVPSRAEAWGMTAFEALSLGTPVLATQVGGLPHLCRDAPHAWLIPDASPDALLAGLAVVLDPAFPRGPRLGDAFSRQPRFDPAARTQIFRRLYERLLGQEVIEDWRLEIRS